MNHKRIFSIVSILLVIVTLVTIMTVNSFANETKFIDNSIIMKLKTNKMIVNGQQKMLDYENPRTMPYLDENNRTLVPIRCITESLGAQVEWIEEEELVVINIDNKIIKFEINNENININENNYKMDTKAIIYEERTYIPLRALIEIGLEKNVYWDNDTQIIVISDNNDLEKKGISDVAKEKILKELDSLSTVENFETFKKLIEINTNYRYYMDNISANDYNSAEKAQESTQVDNEYSQTNSQVKDVDEADIVKTNGKYIYYISSNKLIIVDARTPSDISIIKEIEYSTDDENISFDIQEMFLEDDTLVVIGNESTYKGKESPLPMNYKFDYYYNRYETKTKAICYNISDPSNIVEERVVKVDGYYLDSRRINDNIYLISNKNIYYYNIDELKEDDIKPEYYDSLISNENIKIEFNCIRYFPEIEDSSYSIITSFSTKNDKKAKVETFLGMSDNIYMDDDNLYVASYDYGNYREGNNTLIYKFDISNQEVTFNSKGKVDGEIINQFSMDEHDGYFRIATTKTSYLDDIERTNELHILNSKMKEVSNITGLANGEKIYSVRFVGDRAYIVTYRQVDPLFVIDTSNPLNPEVLGELKIEGYSTYLHPYDENHLIGFGINTQMVDEENVEEKGVKLAMFDVEDPLNPKQMYVEEIGDFGTYSSLQYDHKALLFNKEKNILAFPIVLGKYNRGNYKVNDIGAIIYKVSLKNGFEKQGIISHYYDKVDNIYDATEEEYANVNASIVERIIYINNNYFTLSPNMIKCTNMNDLKELSKVKIKVEDFNNYRVVY